MAYIDAGKAPAAAAGCIFCDLPAAGDDRANLIVGRGELVFAILNRFPYNPGHLMVAPFRHVGDYAELTAAPCSSRSPRTRM